MRAAVFALLLQCVLSRARGCTADAQLGSNVNPVMSLLRPSTLRHRDEVEDLQVARLASGRLLPGAQLTTSGRLSNGKPLTSAPTSLAAGFRVPARLLLVPLQL